MPYRPEHKEKTHRRIVDSAAGEFRTHGFEGVGIAKLMGALELTHGGFYAHFADREALVAEACVAALDQSREALIAGLAAGGFPAVITYYLSEEQRDHPASACLLPSLAAEVARRPVSSRDAFTERLSEIFHELAVHMPGQTPAQRFEKVCVLFSSMVGAMSLARAVSDPVMSRTLLHTTREQLLRFIAEAESGADPSVPEKQL